MNLYESNQERITILENQLNFFKVKQASGDNSKETADKINELLNEIKLIKNNGGGYMINS